MDDSTSLTLKISLFAKQPPSILPTAKHHSPTAVLYSWITVYGRPITLKEQAQRVNFGSALILFCLSREIKEG